MPLIQLLRHIKQLLPGLIISLSSVELWDNTSCCYYLVHQSAPGAVWNWCIVFVIAELTTTADTSTILIGLPCHLILFLVSRSTVLVGSTDVHTSNLIAFDVLVVVGCLTPSRSSYVVLGHISLRFEKRVETAVLLGSFASSSFLRSSSFFLFAVFSFWIRVRRETTMVKPSVSSILVEPEGNIPDRSMLIDQQLVVAYCWLLAVIGEGKEQWRPPSPNIAGTQ